MLYGRNSPTPIFAPLQVSLTAAARRPRRAGSTGSPSYPRASVAVILYEGGGRVIPCLLPLFLCRESLGFSINGMAAREVQAALCRPHWVRMCTDRQRDPWLMHLGGYRCVSTSTLPPPSPEALINFTPPVPLPPKKRKEEEKKPNPQPHFSRPRFAHTSVHVCRPCARVYRTGAEQRAWVRSRRRCATLFRHLRPAHRAAPRWL